MASYLFVTGELAAPSLEALLEKMRPFRKTTMGVKPLGISTRPAGIIAFNNQNRRLRCGKDHVRPFQRHTDASVLPSDAAVQVKKSEMQTRVGVNFTSFHETPPTISQESAKLFFLLLRPSFPPAWRPGRILSKRNPCPKHGFW